MAEVTQGALEAKVEAAKAFVEEATKILGDAAAAAAADTGNAQLAKALEDARTLATDAPAEVDKAQKELDDFIAVAKADADKAEADAKAELVKVDPEKIKAEAEAALAEAKGDADGGVHVVYEALKDFTTWVGTQLVEIKKGTILEDHVGPAQNALGAPVAPVSTETVTPTV